MATMLPPDVVLTFQNTGREHPATYDFLRDLEKHLGRPIVWLEYLPPLEVGAPPVESRFKIVSYETADRTGRPFLELMRALRAYRATKGKGPIAPWWRQRLCTTYLKIRVQKQYVASLGVDEWDNYIGLRADEPTRVAQARARETQKYGIQVPLFERGITKEDVNAYWAEQSFDLQCEPHQGNCTACFLKDESDLARVLMEPETDHAWWEAIQEEFPGFGGNDKTPYVQLRAEGPVRQRIRAALRVGAEPVLEGDARRFKLLVRQERRSLAGETPSFSCNCEIGGEEID